MPDASENDESFYINGFVALKAKFSNVLFWHTPSFHEFENFSIFQLLPPSPAHLLAIPS